MINHQIVHPTILPAMPFMLTSRAGARLPPGGQFAQQNLQGKFGSCWSLSTNRFIRSGFGIKPSSLLKI